MVPFPSFRSDGVTVMEAWALRRGYSVSPSFPRQELKTLSSMLLQIISIFPPPGTENPVCSNETVHIIVNTMTCEAVPFYRCENEAEE